MPTLEDVFLNVVEDDKNIDYSSSLNNAENSLIGKKEINSLLKDSLSVNGIWHAKKYMIEIVI